MLKLWLTILSITPLTITVENDCECAGNHIHILHDYDIRIPHGGGALLDDSHIPHGGGDALLHDIHSPHGGGDALLHDIRSPHGGGDALRDDIRSPHGGGDVFHALLLGSIYLFYYSYESSNTCSFPIFKIDATCSSINE